MILAAQYHRAPFPEKRFWETDLDRMKESGLNALQLWVMWSWVEAEPGVFNFEEYDELFEEARKRELGIVLSTKAELHPPWIHRVIPDSHMIDHMGNKVISTNRVEANQGLTPGGCTDNPEVLKRMEAFLRETARRYADKENLVGWDIWNELRWNMQADGLVCHCKYTLEAFRNWLEMKYMGLDGLNKAWKRRYVSWEDVYPGKMCERPYTEMMEFQAFLQWRAAQHMKFRADIIKAYDKKHIVTAHGPQPSIAQPGNPRDHQAVDRGNDWDHAEHLDGYGCSHFPFWFKISEEDFGIRVEATRSAAGDKPVWISELQGGSARNGFEVFPSVQARPQQRWVWNGYGRGAKAVIFWCWRDEMFGKESSGYGLAGYDGYAEERLEAMKVTGRLLEKHRDILEKYVPDSEKAGVYFDVNTYNLEWAKDGQAARAMKSIYGFCKALERVNIPYTIVESNHLESLKNIKVLFMPFPLIVPEEAAHRIRQFVEDGGTLMLEAEAGCFNLQGFYSYPGNDRCFAYSLGIADQGRRVLEDKEMTLRQKGEDFNLKMSQFITPLRTGVNNIQGKVLGTDAKGNVLAVENKVGKGTVISIGSYIGMSYYEEPYSDFEKLVYSIVDDAKAYHEIQAESDDWIQWRSGLSGSARMMFIINPGKQQRVKVTVPEHMFKEASQVEDLLMEKYINTIIEDRKMIINVELTEGGYTILKWKRGKR